MRLQVFQITKTGEQTSWLQPPALHLLTSGKKIEGNKVNAVLTFLRCQLFGGHVEGRRGW